MSFPTCVYVVIFKPLTEPEMVLGMFFTQVKAEEAKVSLLKRKPWPIREWIDPPVVIEAWKEGYR